MHRPERVAFSLVELSIVLVILGLLVGGILAGQSLIRAAELRAVGTEHQRWMTAVSAFRDKYFGLPGDMTTATSIWGQVSGTPSACYYHATDPGGTLTCDGNGDGMVFPNAGSTEHFRFWQQLANAGLIEGRYVGTYRGAGQYSSTRENSPGSKISGALWFARYYGAVSAASGATMFDGQYGNLFLFGATTTAEPRGGLFKPEEIWNIDTKLDDGLPARGRAVVYSTTGVADCTTVSASATLTGTYLLSGTSPACAIMFRNQF